MKSRYAWSNISTYENPEKTMKTRDDFFTKITVIALSLLISILQGFAAESRSDDSKIALVNGAVIFKNDLDRDVNLLLRKTKEGGKDVSEDRLSDIRKQVLKDLIDRELLYQEGLKEKISIDRREVGKQFELIKKLYSDEKIFSDKLSFMHLSESEMKFQIKKNLIVRRFINDTIVPGIYVTEEESRDFYKKNMKKFRQAEKIRASHIMIQFPPDARGPEKLEARKKIEKILKRIRNGEKFEDLARKFSEGPSIGAGGDLGYLERKNMAKPFSDAAFSLKTGETSDIIETPIGFHLIRVLDKMPESDATYEEAKKEIDLLLVQKKLNEKIKSCLDKLRQNSSIEIFEEEIASKTEK
jgi:peptidyl-prolyl cis-trans isomerase C